MRLGVNLGYRLTADVESLVELATVAESLGYSVAWVAEAYGSDAVSVLGYLAASTNRIGIGAAVMQIPARSPAATAMTAASLDLLSHGRFRLGLGVSGPQVSEGWHGVPFGSPLARTREYVEVVRQILSGRPVSHAGVHYPLPLQGGEGKPLRLAVRPLRADVPIYLAAVGPRNVALAAEVADGWLAILLSPDQSRRPLLDAMSEEARRKPGPSRSFDIAATVPVCVGDDLEACADAVRPYHALYVGGMGSRTHNFYNHQARRLGFGAAAAAIQDHYLAGRPRDAAAAVPFALVDATSLLGTPDRIRARIGRYAEAGVTTINVLPCVLSGQDPRTVLRTVAEAVEAAGLAG